MNEGRKFPAILGWLGFLLLAGSIFLTWYLTRPTTDPAGTALVADDLEVACTGRVDTATRTISLEPEVAGKVIKVHVEENAPNNKVTKGAKILDIDPRLYKIKVEEAQRAVDAAKVEVDRAELEKEMFPEQLLARKELLAMAAARVLQAEKSADGIREQQKEALKAKTPPSAISQLQLDAAVAVVNGVKAQEKVEKKQVEIYEKSGIKLVEQGVSAATAKLKAASAALDEANRALEECTLKAPADGTILQLNVAEGGVVSPMSPVPYVVFAPAGPFVVRADLEQEFVYRVKPGMPVELRDEARSNSPLWTGKVVTVSEYIARKRSILLDPGEMNDVRTAECVIAIDPSNELLRIGQRMRVRIQTR
jgi:multidrug resistance efflux pump